MENSVMSKSVMKRLSIQKGTGMVKKTRLVRGVLTSVTSQRVQYKPYGYEVNFSGLSGQKPVVVEVEIPADTVVSDEGSQSLIISLDGLKAILRVTADAVDELHDEYIGGLK